MAGAARDGSLLMDDESALPPIEDWWPALTIGARHTILEDLHAPLDDRVREEIERITGTAVPAGAALSHHEVGFVETQQQPVD